MTATHGSAPPLPPAEDVRVGSSDADHPTQPPTQPPRQPPSQPPRHRGLPARLDDEWGRTRHHRRALRHARTWAPRVDAEFTALIASVDDLDDLVEASHAERGPAGERLLREFVRLASTDQLAGQIVVRRMLPGILAATTRYRGLCNHADPIGEAVGALWIALADFDPTRRRGPVAASIISDSMFIAFRQRVRRRSATEQPVEPNTLDEQDATDAPCPFLELATVVGEARAAGLPTHDVELIRHLVRAESPGLVARQRRVTPRTVRNHRDAAIGRIRAAVDIAAA